MVLKKYNLHFHENFGPGTENYCGKDTIFLMEMLDKKVKFSVPPWILQVLIRQKIPGLKGMMNDFSLLRVWF